MSFVSDFLEEDVNEGEVRIVGLAALPTGIWAIAKVVQPEDDDWWRAYPEQNYANKIGLICTSGTTRKQVLDDARRWS